MAEQEKNKSEDVEPLTTEDERDVERFVENSQNYCNKVYRRSFEDNELEDLRKEIKDTNEAVKKVREDWGLAQ